tara:strand:+ start:235 stop:522 length:288 start_codon:yes stop_codon:yes gene_type:complete
MNSIIAWDEEFHTWDDNDHKWDFVIHEILGNTGKVEQSKVKKLDKKKKKKLVRLIMHRNGIKVYDEKKEVKTLHHKIKDIELIVEEIKRNVQIIY